MLNRNDLIDIVKLLGVIWLGLVFVVLLKDMAGLVTLRGWAYSPQADLANITLRMWLPWLILSPALVMVIKRFPFQPDRWVKALGLHLLFVMVFIFVHLAAIAYHYQYFVPEKSEAMRVYAGWEHMGHFLVADPFILTDFIIYVLFVATFNIAGFVRLIREKEQDASRLEASLMEARLQALQMQVNPHFLFNTLNGISVLVQKRDFATAEEMIHRLSDFFRMTLEKRMDQRVPLETEIELLDNYLAIEQMRFKDRLTVEKDIDRRTLGVPVPAMILQPLVENSLRHGINAIEGPGLLRIRSSWLGDRILLEVSDNGPGCPPYYSAGFRQGVGLSNVRGRLQQLYGNGHVFSFDSRPGEGTVVRIELPAASSDVTPVAAAASPAPAITRAIKTGETPA